MHQHQKRWRRVGYRSHGLRDQIRDWHPWYERLWRWVTRKPNPWRRIKRH